MFNKLREITEKEKSGTKNYKAESLIVITYENKKELK